METNIELNSKQIAELGAILRAAGDKVCLGEIEQDGDKIVVRLFMMSGHVSKWFVYMDGSSSRVHDGIWGVVKGRDGDRT